MGWGFEAPGIIPLRERPSHDVDDAGGGRPGGGGVGMTREASNRG